MLRAAASVRSGLGADLDAKTYVPELLRPGGPRPCEMNSALRLANCFLSVLSVFEARDPAARKGRNKKCLFITMKIIGPTFSARPNLWLGKSLPL